MHTMFSPSASVGRFVVTRFPLLAASMLLSFAMPSKSENTGASPVPLTFVVAPCSTSVTGGKASLILSTVRSKGGNYAGEYALKVSPYFWMNETGTISMQLTEEAAKKLSEATPVTANGLAVTKKNGKTRKVVATLTPTGKESGSVSFAFTGEDTKLVFNSTYKLGGD